MLCQKSLHECSRMGRRIDADSPICSLGHCECDGHTVYKLSQRLLTADWLDLRESDCSRMRSKVSSYWLPSYSNAALPVLEVYKNGWILSGQPSFSILKYSKVLEFIYHCLWCNGFRLHFGLGFKCRSKLRNIRPEEWNFLIYKTRQISK
jgi:hypothetical protein